MEIAVPEKSGKTSPRTVALWEPAWAGHHPIYLKMFTAALTAIGCRVFVFCQQPKACRRLLTERGDIPMDLVQIFLCPKRAGLKPDAGRLARRAAARHDLGETAHTLTQAESQTGVRIDLVFFCSLDQFMGCYLTVLDVTAMLGRRFSGLYFHPFHLRRPLRHSILRFTFLNPDQILRSRCCSVVGVLDEGIASALQHRLNGKSVIVFPDLADESFPQEPTPRLLAVKQKAGSRKIIGLFGSLEKRKGLLDLIQHSRHLITEPVFFLAAGQVVEQTFTQAEMSEVRDFFCHPPPNAMGWNTYIENEIQFNDLLRGCDLAYAVYPGFAHSSNILTKAACFQVPVVVAEGFLMAERVRTFHLGFVVRPDEPTDFRRLIRSGEAFALHRDDRFIQGCAAYRQQHAIGRLQDSFRQVLDSALA